MAIFAGVFPSFHLLHPPRESSFAPFNPPPSGAPLIIRHIMGSHEATVPAGDHRDPEKVVDSFREASTLLLSEDQALAKARSSPQDALPILLTYAPDDRDNPRNWPKWRKWYITCLVSMLNVFTYVGRAPQPRNFSIRAS